MSVAFHNEDSADLARETEFPPRPISPHPNLVTKAGLDALARGEAAARAALDAASLLDEPLERIRGMRLAERDLAYFHERLLTAELQPEPKSHDIVTFGARVTYRRDGGKPISYRIVGEDEAEPREGSISYIAPLAHALMGKRAGDVVEIDGHEVEVVGIG